MSDHVTQRRQTCELCGHTDLALVLDLGDMPLANALVAESDLGQPEFKSPLEVLFCPHCGLLQTSVTVSPAIIFKDYLYFSSYSDDMLRHCRALAAETVERYHLGGNSLVVELASNDGYLLQYFVERAIPVLGVEPAENVAEVARARGIPTIARFFTDDLAQEMLEEGRAADVIFANNVLAHVPDLKGFVRGIATLLKAEGVAIIETPYARRLVDDTKFDTIYHEHNFYFSLTALRALFSRHSLTIIDVEQIEIHGGSLKVSIKKESAAPDVHPRVAVLLEEEKAAGMDSLPYYRSLAGRVERLTKTTHDVLCGLKAIGASIAAYGAGAKGSIFLNTAGIGAEIIDFVVDRSPHKQGYYMPGVHIPIYAPEKLVELNPDYCLLLTWNFADEIVRQQAGYLSSGRFIIALPEIRII
jgi:SAM-dependent methyltransferase